MYKRLEELIKQCKGNIFTVCLDDKLMSEFDKKNNINLYSLTSNNTANSVIGLVSKKKKDKPKYKKNNKGKDINIKKIRKEINKKSVDYMFCNMNEVYSYYKYFIKDSIYMSNGKIYIYFNNEINKDFIIEKYKRYTSSIKETKYKNGYLLEIDVGNAKNNFLKDILYFIKDTMYNLAELIGNLMIS